VVPRHTPLFFSFLLLRAELCVLLPMRRTSRTPLARAPHEEPPSATSSASGDRYDIYTAKAHMWPTTAPLAPLARWPWARKRRSFCQQMIPRRGPNGPPACG